MREEQALALGEVGEDVLLVDSGLLHVPGRPTMMTSARRTASAVSRTSKPLLLGDGAGLGTGIQADDDLAAAVLEVERVGVALGPEAEHGEGLVLEDPRSASESV